MRLRAQVVNLIGLDLIDQAAEACGIGQIAIVKAQGRLRLVRIGIDVIEAVRVKCRSAADDSVNFVALGEQKLGEIGAVLTGDAGDERSEWLFG